MAYHGYILPVKKFLDTFPENYTPNVLEVGIDRGVTFLSLAVHLLRTRPRFALLGLDINVQESVKIMLQNLDAQDSQVAQLVQQNSLIALPALSKAGAKFDVVLIDGDHNYHTVSEELTYVPSITHDYSIIIIDDYHGRWAKKDLWYSEKEEYTTDIATPRSPSDKEGVASAVDDWLTQNPDWEITTPIPGEPVVLQRKSNSYVHEQVNAE